MIEAIASPFQQHPAFACLFAAAAIAGLSSAMARPFSAIALAAFAASAACASGALPGAALAASGLACFAWCAGSVLWGAAKAGSAAAGARATAESAAMLARWVKPMAAASAAAILVGIAKLLLALGIVAWSLAQA